MLTALLVFLFQDRREFAKFEKERQNAQWDTVRGEPGLTCLERLTLRIEKVASLEGCSENLPSRKFTPLACMRFKAIS